jgi:hypothetical protein
MVPYAIRLSMMAIVLGTSAGFLIGAGYAQEYRYAVKGVVVDQSGAVVPQAEVLFQKGVHRIIAHTGMDGSVKVYLEVGSYVVTVCAFGFAPYNKLINVALPRPSADAFLVTLKVDQSQLGYGSDFGQGWDRSILCDLPNIVQDQPPPVSLPVVQPAATKHRSMRCLFLWRCSASKP